MKVLALIGPSASGKTALAIELAKPLNAIILSLDSLCIYTQINIASAKPSKEELREVLHFGVNIKNVDESFNAGDFGDEYKRALTYASANAKNLIITGGSGFYLASMLNGLAPRVPRQPGHPSNDEIFALASKQDAAFCAKFSANDTFRLQKWYDIYSFLACGAAGSLPPSVWLAQNTQPPLLANIPIFELVWGKDELRQRIKKRTIKMLEDGLIDEARALFSTYSADLKPLKSIGLKECGEFLHGQISDESKLCELISTHTAQLAKHQRTFFNSSFKDAIKLAPNDAYNEILKAL